MGNKTGCVNANDTRTATGLFPGVVLNAVPLAQAQIGLHLRGRPRDADDAGLKPGRYKCPNKVGANRPAGTREALPGTICETFVPHFLRRALDAAPDNQRKSLSVRKHLLDAGHVGFIYQRELLQLAHAAGPFCAHQMALAGVAALALAIGGELKRFLAPRCVFNFNFGFDAFLGIAGNPLLILLSTTSQGAFKVDLGANWGAACCAAKKNVFARLMARITATAGRWTLSVPQAWRRLRLFSGPAMPPKRSLPCAAWFRSGPGRQSP